MEVCPSLFLERQLEDHMSVGEAYNAWPMTCDYRFELRVIETKYDLFSKAAVRVRHCVCLMGLTWRLARLEILSVVLQARLGRSP
jgi:hypothetical protein